MERAATRAPWIAAALLTGTMIISGCEGGAADPNSSPSAAGSTPAASPSSSGSSSATPAASATGVAEAGDPSDFATDLTTPWGLVALSDGSVLVSERDTAVIKKVTDGRSSEIGTVEGVVPSSEGGLLGLAISSDEKTLFAYVSTGEDNRIVSYDFDGSSLGTEKVLLDQIPVSSNHNGGQLIMGPDGFLYAATGDASVRQDAQDTGSLAGKILRLTTDGKAAPDNPFDNEVFSYGHRNVQGLAFDEQGRLWASEFGDQSLDELNLITAGANYGWPAIEGDESELDGMTNPVHVWGTDDNSPSGLAYAQGSLWMGGLRGERLWQIPLEGDRAGEPVAHVEDRGRLRGVLAHEDGILVATSNTDGRGDPRDADDRLLLVPLERA
ncbi:PQQ-dependent sugar dehydrogenase [Propionibacteriaceae bacterium Y1700]|uniref:PQQ-dependent sugar dehydrogenase n=1 Tax=Microlunatus sp. Y1700 TaxID=3418487 RepID=UPI003DA77FC6